MGDGTVVSIDRLFARFVNSSDTFRVYHKGKLIFKSKKEQLRPLLDYIDRIFASGEGSGHLRPHRGECSSLTA